MKTFATALRRTALILTSLFAAGGLLFALGYAFEDPGGWPAVLVAAAVLVPLAGLTFLAVRAPALAVRVLTVGVALFAAWAALSVFVDLVEAPDIPVIALVLSVPIAVVARRYAMRAGWLMLALAAVPFGLVLVRLVRESGVEGPAMSALLGGSTGVVVVPLAIFAGLLLASATLGRQDAGPGQPHPLPPQPRPPHAAARPQ